MKASRGDEYFDLYARSYQIFRTHTNEKQVLLAELQKDIRRFKPKSILDIGAGNGEIAVPIAAMASRYLAVEYSPKHAAHLTEYGLSVVESTFPTKIDGLFDLALLCHCLSYEKRNHNVMIDAAWELIARNGHILIVTHRGEKNDWSNLLDKVGMGKTSEYEDIYDEIVDNLKSKGQTSIRRVVTSATASTADALVAALAFVASAGYKELFNQFMASRHKITEILETTYKTEDGYSFPFTHIFLTTEK